jgi:hypothetical protein
MNTLADATRPENTRRASPAAKCLAHGRGHGTRWAALLAAALLPAAALLVAGGSVFGAVPGPMAAPAPIVPSRAMTSEP